MTDRIRRALTAPLLLLALLMAPLATAQTPAAPAPEGTDAAVPVVMPKVMITTSLGQITLELNPEKAPKSVENFLQYAKDGFYDGTIFHRVVNNFLIAGGGFTPDLRFKPTRPTIASEAKNGLSNLRGTIAMARTADPNSASSVFFINVVDNRNRNLDFVSDERSETWGYTVFGKVIAGMDVVDAIKAVPTGPKGPFRSDVPTTDVVIQKVEILP